MIKVDQLSSYKHYAKFKTIMLLKNSEIHLKNHIPQFCHSFPMFYFCKIFFGGIYKDSIVIIDSINPCLFTKWFVYIIFLSRYFYAFFSLGENGLWKLLLLKFIQNILCKRSHTALLVCYLNTILLDFLERRKISFKSLQKFSKFLKFYTCMYHC